MFDSKEKEVEAAETIIARMSNCEDISKDVKRSIVFDLKVRLEALDGNHDSLVEMFLKSGLRYEDARVEATMYILTNKPRGKAHAARTVLERTPGSPYLLSRLQPESLDDESALKLRMARNAI